MVIKKRKVEFGKGTVVEVSIQEDGFRGSYYLAVIVQALSRERYRVRYERLVTDEGGKKEPLMEIVYANQLRPCPPEIRKRGGGCGFSLSQEVDAFHRDGWWVGAVSHLMVMDDDDDDDRRKSNGKKIYGVYFKDSYEELKFRGNQLRVHQEWIHGSWVVSSLPKTYVHSTPTLEIAAPQEVSFDQIEATTRVLSVKEAMEIRMSNEIVEKDIAKEADDTLVSQELKEGGDVCEFVCPNSEAKLLLLPGTWSEEFEASKRRLSNLPGDYVNENVGTSSKPKPVVYCRRSRKAVPYSRPHGTVLSDAFPSTTPLSGSLKSCCAATNVNAIERDDSKDLNMTTYHSILEAFYRKGGHSWEDDLVLTRLRNVLDITNNDHLKHLKLMTSRSSRSDFSPL